MDHLENWPQKAVGNNDFTKPTIVIIGAGFSGMCIAIKLLEKRIRHFVVIEKGDGIGGTWKDNKYPGSCCDILSHLYCYSFEQNPDWSRLYPGQEEILDYQKTVASKYDLYKNIRFGSNVTEAHWDNEAKKWKISVEVSGDKEAEFEKAYTLTTDFLISGVGQLNEPYYPNLLGAADFQGKIMHSARWDWSYDVRGKRVAIIGNGATAIQIVPEIAKIASHLTVFQRTPNWLIPRMDRNISELKKWMLRNVPFLLRRMRADIMDGRESYFQAIIKRHSTESSVLTKICQEYIKSEMKDRPDLWSVLTPKYPPGCKRLLLSDDYYKTLCFPNVSLETRSMRRLTRDGIQVSAKGNGTAEDLDVDLIIYATGFRAKEFLHPMKVYGLGNRSTEDIWKNGARALYGVSVESLPNFAMMYGPNTNLGHNSIILMIEAQARYVVKHVEQVIKARQHGQTLSITPRAARVQSWNEKLQKDLATSSFADPRCSSWYKTDEGLITNNWSSTVVDYQKLLSKIDWSDYLLEGTASTNLVGRKVNIGRNVEETWISQRTLAFTLLSGLILTGGVALKAALSAY